MSYNFGRKLRFEIGKRGLPGLSIQDLRVDFNVEKNSESNANKSKITIYNLNENSRGIVQEADYFSLYVGYEDAGTEYLLLTGDISKISIFKQEMDIITEIDVEEGKKDLEESFVNKAYAKGTSKKKIIIDAIKSLGLSKVFDESKVNFLLSALDRADQKLQNGSVVSQKAKDILDKLLGFIGYSWSIQNDEVIIFSDVTFVEDESYLITPENGMIGSPIKTEKGIDLKTILLPDIRIGSKVQVESAFFSGIFKVVQLNHSGSLFTSEWVTQLKTIEVKF